MSEPDRYQRPPLRYKRFGGGYRREDVEFALAELRLTLRQLDNDLASLRDRNRVLEAELQQARTGIESFRGKEHELSNTMSAALRRAAEIEEGANNRAREITAQAEEAAMRIRSEASRRIETSSAQFDELLRLKDNLLAAMRSVVGDFDQAISRVERGERLFPGVLQGVRGEAPSSAPSTPSTPPTPPAPVAEAAPPPAEPWPVPVETPAAAPAAPTEPAPAPPFVAPVEPVAPPPASAPAPDTASIPATPPPPLEPVAPAAPPVAPPSPSVTPAQQPVAAAPPPPPPSPPPAPAPPPAAPAPPEPEAELFETRVELDAGPFADFAALSAFERSLAHLPKVEDVYVRRLADDRALIELTLSEPAPLLQTMKESLPYSLDVRSANGSKLVVNVAAQTPAAAR